MKRTRDRSRSQKGANWILLVEGETAARSTAQEALADMGYLVKAADGSAEAIGLYRLAKERGEPYEAVIIAAESSDGVSSPETLEYLRQLDPQVQVIVTGASPEDPVMCDYRRLGFRDRLVRPYGAKELTGILSG